MYYIGIDPSLTATAIVVLDDDLNIVKKRIISSKLKDIQRVIDIAETLESELWLYIAASSDPNKEASLFMEGYSFGSRAGQAFSIGELGGVIKYKLDFMGLGYKLIPPTVLKKFVTGKGNAKKELILKEVFKKWKVDLDDNNLADGYGLARMAWARVHQSGLLKYEKEVMEKYE